VQKGSLSVSRSGPIRGISGFPRFVAVQAAEQADVMRMHSRFASSLASTLSIYLRSLVSAAPQSIEEVPHGRCRDEAGRLSCTGYLKLRSSSTYATVRLCGSLVAFILELLMGASGKRKAELDRELTPIEQELFEPVFRLVTEDLNGAGYSPGALQFESSVARAGDQISPSEPVVAIRTELMVGESSGALELFLPSLIVRHLSRRAVESPDTPRSSEYQMSCQLAALVWRELTLQVQCELDGITVSLRELAGLGPGVVLDLGIPFDSPVTIAANSVPKFRGWISQRESRMSVVIDSRVEATYPSQKSRQ
jgi:flagellar motor switch protein FliM